MKQKDPAAVELGRKGGLKTKKLHPDHHKKAGKKGAEARWGKTKGRKKKEKI